jgi:hypothetical protein
MIIKTIEKLRSGLRGALDAGEGLAERVALAEVDAAIQTRVRGIIIPTFVVALLFAIVQLAAAFIVNPETLRFTTTSIVLAAGVYGLWTLGTGLIRAMPVLSVWWATRTTPHNLARLMLYELILRKLRTTFTSEQGTPTPVSHVVRYALKFSGVPASWESYALHLADRIAPRMVRHGTIQIAMVLVPILIAITYYRLKIYPDIIHAQTGLGVWSAFLYPVAALIDWATGSHLRQIL